ncbi:hypothetical protein CC86DRAFT_366340 [Ophiobolus disseminans]|uniref:Rhodopsin domain-containing protein n=1 Tax=Ophiobolus disseminans TaxID=1469910 RepID=A0A6A7AH10_9PLEO|nr:hypothetical protein CC86DRAFT_366340 [Ophiobolus disseminans]
MALPFNQESWIWYTCAVCMIGARLISRSMHLRSLKTLQYDDYIMGLFVTAAYTAMIVCANRYVKAQSNLFLPGFDVSVLTEYDLKRRRYGSKMAVVVEQTTIGVIWSCKACLLIMYHRLTRMALRNENIAIKILSAYVGLSFVVIEVLYFAAWCRPVSEYWAVPTSSSQCNALVNHRITKAVFNLSSDIVMLTIALQMLIRSLLPMKRKIILCGIFSLGIFVVIASVMNSYYSFKHPYKQTWVDWYVRETSTAILVANLPFTWTILREIFDLDTFEGSSPPPWTFHSARTAHGRRAGQRHSYSTHTAATARTRVSPTISKGSHGTQPMTLVDSMTPLRHHSRNHSGSPRNSETEKDLSGTAVASHDFAPMPSPSADLGVIDIDLEQGIEEDVQVRPVSPADSHQPPPRITEDGTGGFYINDRPISPPPRAYLTTRSNHGETGLASMDKRPTSPTPSFASFESTDKRPQRAGSGAGTAGTGRSARDRRARARMSGHDE